MDKKQRIQLYERATKKWGWNAQIDQVIEEMAELIVALNKYKRKSSFNNGKNLEDIKKNLYTELADVSICLEQMINFFGEEDVKKAKKTQIRKFISQIED